MRRTYTQRTAPHSRMRRRRRRRAQQGQGILILEKSCQKSRSEVNCKEGS